MKKISALLALSLLFFSCVNSQAVVANSNGNQSIVLNNGSKSTIVNPDGTHSTVFNQGITTLCVNPDGLHSFDSKFYREL